MDKRISLISKLQAYQVCLSCGVVDKDAKRTLPGHPCSKCEAPSKGGLMFFHMETQMLVDMIDETWRNRKDADKTKTRPHDLSMIIFYCTLQEILMHELLESNMLAFGVPQDLTEKVLKDNLSISRRVDSLFPVLTGNQFKDAVIEESDEKDQGEVLLDIWEKAIDTRNSFMHRGDQWGIPEGLPESCWKSVLPLCDLFVRLTNRYATKKVGT